MRIALFADCFLPQVNGIVTAVLNLSQGMAKKGHKILIIAPKYRKVVYPKLHENIEILTVRGIPALFYPGLKFTAPFNKKILNALVKNQIELIHFHAPMMLGLQAVILAKILKLPLIGTFHTFFGDSAYLKHAKLDYKIIEKLSWQLVKFYYNPCNLITTPTESTKKILIQNKSRKPIKVISNGIDPEIFDNTKSAEIRQKYNPSGPLCLFVGRIAYEKNLLFLIDVFHGITKKIPEAKLLIVGGGPQLELVQKKIAQLNITNKIELLGEIPYENLVKSGIYGACDLFLTASKTETQGLTILEAQVNGLVCVGMKAKGVPEVIINNINGYTVSHDDKKAFVNRVCKLLENKDLLLKMKKRTLEMVQKHFTKNIMGKWESTYQETIKNYEKDKSAPKKKNWLHKINKKFL